MYTLGMSELNHFLWNLPYKILQSSGMSNEAPLCAHRMWRNIRDFFPRIFRQLEMSFSKWVHIYDHGFIHALPGILAPSDLLPLYQNIWRFGHIFWYGGSRSVHLTAIVVYMVALLTLRHTYSVQSIKLTSFFCWWSKLTFWTAW